MSELWALLPAAGAESIMEAVRSLAGVSCTAGDAADGAGAVDARTPDQRRADALVELGARVLHDPQAPRTQGLRPHIQVTIAASTLLGLDDIPAELAGYGPIPAGVAREIAADPTGTWRRLLTDPVSGTLLDFGTSRYRPPPALARHVIARDQECVFPYCHRRAHRCDIDHRVRRADGGPTDHHHLVPLCPRHHPAKDDAGWTLRAGPPGEYRWTSPTGHAYVKHVPTYPVPADDGEPRPD